MAKGHSYAFNMGNNQIIPFQDFKEAIKALMERNMPEVLHNRQMKAVIMPETHLPTMPRIVDEQRYVTRKRNLEGSILQFLGMKPGSEDSQNARGDLAEKELFIQLQKFYENSKVVVFWGPKLRVPGKDHQEFDFVIVDLELKAVISIESKATLNVKTGVGLPPRQGASTKKDKSAAAQTQRLKELLEQYFGPELASNAGCNFKPGGSFHKEKRKR